MLQEGSRARIGSWGLTLGVSAIRFGCRWIISRMGGRWGHADADQACHRSDRREPHLRQCVRNLQSETRPVGGKPSVQRDHQSRRLVGAQCYRSDAISGQYTVAGPLFHRCRKQDGLFAVPADTGSGRRSERANQPGGSRRKPDRRSAAVQQAIFECAVSVAGAVL